MKEINEFRESVSFIGGFIYLVIIVLTLLGLCYVMGLDLTDQLSVLYGCLVILAGIISACITLLLIGHIKMTAIIAANTLRDN